MPDIPSGPVTLVARTDDALGREEVVEVRHLHRDHRGTEFLHTMDRAPDHGSDRRILRLVAEERLENPDASPRQSVGVERAAEIGDRSALQRCGG